MIVSNTLEQSKFCNEESKGKEPAERTGNKGNPDENGTINLDNGPSELPETKIPISRKQFSSQLLRLSVGPKGTINPKENENPSESGIPIDSKASSPLRSLGGIDRTSSPESPNSKPSVTGGSNSISLSPLRRSTIIRRDSKRKTGQETGSSRRKVSGDVFFNRESLLLDYANRNSNVVSYHVLRHSAFTCYSAINSTILPWAQKLFGR